MVHILNKSHFWSTVYTRQIHQHIPWNNESLNGNFQWENQDPKSRNNFFGSYGRYLTFVSHFPHVSMQTTLMNWLDLKSPSQALEFILRISLQCGWKSRHLKSLKIHMHLFLMNLNINYFDSSYPYCGSCGVFSSVVVFSQQNNSSPNSLSQLQTVGGFFVPKRNFL